MNAEGSRLSPQQGHLWRRHISEDSPYRSRSVVAVEGKLEVATLKSAIQDAVDRYEILRTIFPGSNETDLPRQVVTSGDSLSLEEMDLSSLPPAEQESAVEALSQRTRNQPLELSRGPIFHVFIITLSAEMHRLLFLLPALCMDSAGLNNLTREIGRFYASRLMNEEPGGEILQYVDIAEWQNDVLEGEVGQRGRTFWRSQSFLNLFALRLPFENQPAGVTRFQPRSLVRTIPAHLAEQMEAFVIKQKIPTPVLLLNCWQLLLWRLTGEEEIAVGNCFDGRQYEELKPALGLLARYLPVCCHFEPQAKLTEVLRQCDQAVAKVTQWQEFFSWEQFQSSTGDGAGKPFVPFCFDFEESDGAFSVGSTSFSDPRKYVCIDRFKVKLSCLRRRDQLFVTFEYDPAFYGADKIHRLGEQYQALLESAINRPDADIGVLNIVPEGERKRLLFEFNDTEADYPQNACIHHLIEEQCERTPDKPAVVFLDQSLTYAELNARSNQLAHYLRAGGVRPDVLVGICIERSLEMVIGILAVLKAGGAYVPLDPGYPEERLSFVLGDTQAPVVLTRSGLLPKLKACKSQLVCLDNWEAIGRESVSNPTGAVSPKDLAYVIYTSGSTGKPKGAIINHQGLLISNSSRNDFYKESVEKFLLLSSFAFDSSVVGIFWTLSKGGTLLLVPEELQQNLPELDEVLSDHRVSHLLTLPSFYSLILEHAKPRQLECLRTVIVAGEPCPKKLVDRHKELLPYTAIYSEYGATETTVFSSVYNCLSQKLEIAPIGLPIANAQIYVLDSHFQPVPVGIAGEVYFGGDALAEGYLNRPDLTAERFVPNPFSKKGGSRLYRSGDLARHLEDGEVEFLGRVDNQVKIRGFRVELEEIDTVLLQHPVVKEAVVVAREWSERQSQTNPDGTGFAESPSSGGKRLVAYIVSAAEQAPPGIGELRRFLMEKLPDYMVPAAFVMLDALPRIPNGKVDRRALPEPGSARPELAESFTAARSPIEQTLARIWAEVLRLERVGIHDNFFELGGDSILSIQVIARASRAGISLMPMQIFQHQTIAELAQVAGKVRTITAEQGEVRGQSPLTPIQCWFFGNNPPEPQHWNLSLMLEMRQSVSPGLIEAAVRELIAHHDVFRLHFYRTTDWKQEFSGLDQVIPFDSVDLSFLGEREQKIALAERAAGFQVSLNLEKGPLMRLVLFNLGPHRPSRLLWILHHLVGDVVSWRILLEDLETALRQLGRGEAVCLPPKTTSFKYWAERLEKHAQSGALREELDYWLDGQRQKVKGLPVDFPEGKWANTETSTRVVKVRLQAQETRALLQDVPKAYNTQINEVLLTALAHSFSRWTGEPFILFDVESHGREDIFEDVDLSRTVGWFTSFFPVLLEVGKTTDPGEALNLTKEQLRRIPNRGIGYSLLRYLAADIEITAKLQNLPRAAINFNYLGQFDQILEDSALFVFAQDQESVGPERSPGGTRPYLLDIVGCVIGGCLQVEWSYSENVFQRATVEKLAENFLNGLRSIVGQCPSFQTEDFTAEEFAEFKWNQADLNSITAAILKSEGKV